MDSALTQKIAELPQAPGCYLMHDHSGEIIYVGKAVNLRARVRSYFTKTDTRAFVSMLDEILGDVEVILTLTEKEALLLENELIKKHQPRFNVMLRDDKNFISLRLDVRQPYPRLEVVRRIKKDGARYFGPYSSASSIRETLRVVNRYFQLRTCSDQVMHNRRRPCLQYQIKRCPGPCVYDVPKEEYARSIDDVSMFLSGKADELTGTLKQRMRAASAELRFEDAAMLRDQIIAVERSLEKQRTVNVDLVDQDVFGLYREGPLLVIEVLFVRQGKLTGGRHFPFKGQEFPDDELIGQFLGQYYEVDTFIPREVLLPVELEDLGAEAEWLSDRKGEKVHVLVPQRGEKVRLLAMARENAEHNFREWRKGQATNEDILLRLQKRLRLSKLPRRIECYDNSHLMGTLAVGSRVTFTDGIPDKARYRHYKVRTAKSDDDFEMMFEVLTRRLARGKAERDLPDLVVIDGGKGQLNVAREVLKEQGLTGAVELCSLAKARVVDDEKLFASRQGFAPEDFHVEAQPEQATPAGTHPSTPAEGLATNTPSSAKVPTARPSSPADQERSAFPRDERFVSPRAADVPATSSPVGESGVEVGSEAQPTGGTAPAEPQRARGKSRNPGRYRQGAVERSPERVFLPGQKNPIVLRANSSELFLLQRLRDEAHRFAITFQRRLRRSSNFKSVLREIPGVGDTRQKALLTHFGSLRRVRDASVEELAQVDGVPAKLADEIWRFFHANGQPAESAETAGDELAVQDSGLEEVEAEQEDALDEENARVLDEVASEVAQTPAPTDASR